MQLLIMVQFSMVKNWKEIVNYDIRTGLNVMESLTILIKKYSVKKVYGGMLHKTSRY